jgi:hypothetical protein
MFVGRDARLVVAPDRSNHAAAQFRWRQLGEFTE